MHTAFSFPNPFLESEELPSWGCSKILLSFMMQSDSHFLSKSATAGMFTQFTSILDGHLSRHLLPAPFCLEIENTTLKFLIGSQPHSHTPFAPILVFLSQIDQLWNKILWQLSVHFCHPWCIKKTDFTRQVLTRTLSKINKRNSVCERMVDST
jgi:hypothetical protein